MEQKGYKLPERTKYSSILGSFFILISFLSIYLHYNTVYTHPTSSGNKHIPSGGSAGQILRWSSDGTAVWGSDNNTTYGTGDQYYTIRLLNPLTNGKVYRFYELWISFVNS